MKKRNLFAVFILSFITFGLYELYWSYVVRKDLIAINKDEKSIPPIHWLLVLLYIAVPVIILALLTSLARDIFEPVFDVSIMVLVASMFASVFIYFWWYWHFCNTFFRVIRGNDAVLIYILWIISRIVVPVWNLMGQSDINKYLAKQQKGQSAAQPASSPTNPVA